jgi:hypothetical protein
LKLLKLGRSFEERKTSTKLSLQKKNYQIRYKIPKLDVAGLIPVAAPRSKAPIHFWEAYLNLRHDALNFVA